MTIFIANILINFFDNISFSMLLFLIKITKKLKWLLIYLVFKANC